MDSKTYSSILKTVCYADIFDYPLKEKEVHHWIKDIRILRYPDIKRANGVISHKGSWMFLKDREDLVAIRQQRETISKRKLLIAKGAIMLLKRIPTIKLVGVSGSVAMHNAREKDDIDFFVIAKEGTVWLTRFLATVAIELFSERRRPNETYVADKICLNMFVDEDYLTVPKGKRNLYTAHEVCQLKVLYDKDGTYQKFLVANKWVREYLPNGIEMKKLRNEVIKKEFKATYLITLLLYYFNAIAKTLQLWYMRRRITTETITDGYLAFHPKDYTNDVLAAFEERVALYASKI